ncbi:F-box/FBD/LRR-repeat protein [Trifolium repens]|nr:F-box/FBD/LRR-repeat protein [Trifolium repens]
MSLSNKKADQGDQIDRISNLPSNVIDVILEHLDIRDRVRTSILSTKWRYMWTSVPQLEFSEEFFERYEYLDNRVASRVVAKIITKVLLLHNGPIYKFSFFIPIYFKFKMTLEHLDMWVPLLSMRGVKHLELVNSTRAFNQMPCIIFSCKELTNFKFGGFILSIPPNFSRFKRLLALDIDSVTFESCALENLISGCPLLEKLRIECCNGFEYFDFSAPTLKVLFLEFDRNVKSICLKKAENLIDLTLIAMECWESGLIKSLPKNIQRFSISSYFPNEISYADMIPLTLLKSSFNSIKYLKLDYVKLNKRRELLYIVSVLKSAPCLVELVVKSHFSHVDITQVPHRLEELECSSICLHQLQTVNFHICAYYYQHAMSLIQFILANSTSLKILSFEFYLVSLLYSIGCVGPF